MTTVSSASSVVTEAEKNHPPLMATKGKVRVMCRYGGSIVSLPQMKSLHYVGGDTRIVAVPMTKAMNFSSLVNHLAITLGVSYRFKIKYQLPDHGLDSLISVETGEDLQIMMEEHGRLSSESPPSQSRIRLFLFPVKPRVNDACPNQTDSAQSKATAGEIDWLIGESEPSRCQLTQPMLQHPKTDTWFVDALRSSGIVQNEGSSGDGNGGLCGQESIVLETNSSFGSSSSSVSLTNLPPIKSSGEDNMANLQVKFTPTESVASENGVATPTQDLPTHPHQMENKVNSNLYESNNNLNLSHMNKPIPILGYPPNHQHIQFIYPNQHYIVPNPSPSYYPPYHPFPQPHPQPYPVYYIPIEQYHQPYSSNISTNQPPTNPNTSLSTQQSESPVGRCNSPLIPELTSPIYTPSQSVDSMVHSSNETENIDNDVEEDTVRAQIYKSQPPAPMLSSQFQTVMLTEAFTQLRTGNA